MAGRLGVDMPISEQVHAVLYRGQTPEAATRRLLERAGRSELARIIFGLDEFESGRIVLDESMEAIGARYAEVAVRPESAAQARRLGPLYEREVFGRRVFLFEGQSRERLDELGERRVPGIADLFVAMMGGDR